MNLGFPLPELNPNEYENPSDLQKMSESNNVQI